jgi:hypothetical protein
VTRHDTAGTEKNPVQSPGLAGALTTYRHHHDRPR